jgi:hemerythrin-like domain-containing protein
MDAITLLRDDHKTVEQLFKRFEKAGDSAYVEKRQIVERIIEELSKHAAIEEQLFYPVARATVADVEDITLESLEEHHIVKWLLSELVDLDPTHERFDAKVTVLIENVRHHVEEEETEFFPKVRRDLSRSALADLGNAMAAAKKSAPTHPHPRSPDTPPANAVVGTIAGVIDRVSDNISGIAQGGISAAQDLIARVLNTDKPKVSPTGSSVARGRANNVRRTASTAVDEAEQTARSIKSGAASTARAASSGIKGTATTAKRSARATATTAKRGATTAGRTARTATNRTAATAKRAASRTVASAKTSR